MARLASLLCAALAASSTLTLPNAADPNAVTPLTGLGAAGGSADHTQGACCRASSAPRRNLPFQTQVGPGNPLGLNGAVALASVSAGGISLHLGRRAAQATRNGLHKLGQLTLLLPPTSHSSGAYLVQALDAAMGAVAALAGGAAAGPAAPLPTSRAPSFPSSLSHSARGLGAPPPPALYPPHKRRVGSPLPPTRTPALAARASLASSPPTLSPGHGSAPPPLPSTSAPLPSAARPASDHGTPARAPAAARGPPLPLLPHALLWGLAVAALVQWLRAAARCPAPSSGALPTALRCAVLALLLLPGAQAACPGAAAPGAYCVGSVEVPCPAGAFCAGGGAARASCPAGTYRNTTGGASSASCNPCAAGTYSTVVGAVLSTTCSPCAAGTFSTTPGANSIVTCLPCAAGSFSPPGASSCAFTATTCPIGTYASGAAACAPCSPATACTVPGLSAQPPCFWSASTLAGSGAAGWMDGQGTAARFDQPHGVSVDPVTLSVFVGDMWTHRVRKISPTGLVSTVAGSGLASFANGLGTTARFNGPHGVSVDALGNAFVADLANHCVRKILPSGLVTTIAGSGTQ